MEQLRLVVTAIDKPIEELVSKGDHKTLAIWATDCAERALPYFEEKYSEDNRPREAIAAGRAWVLGKLEMVEARKAAFAAHAAARDVKQDKKACSAARACGHAAATAHVPSHATYAAIYAATAFRDATSSTGIVIKEREWQYKHLLELKKNA